VGEGDATRARAVVGVESPVRVAEAPQRLVTVGPGIAQAKVASPSPSPLPSQKSAKTRLTEGPEPEPEPQSSRDHARWLCFSAAVPSQFWDGCGLDADALVGQTVMVNDVAGERDNCPPSPRDSEPCGAKFVGATGRVLDCRSTRWTASSRHTVELEGTGATELRLLLKGTGTPFSVKDTQSKDVPWRWSFDESTRTNEPHWGHLGNLEPLQLSALEQFMRESSCSRVDRPLRAVFL
jgi:hypothetical protein